MHHIKINNVEKIKKNLAIASPSYSIKISIDFPRHSPRGGGTRSKLEKLIFFCGSWKNRTKKKTFFIFLWKFCHLVKTKFFEWFYIGKIYILNQFLLSPNVRQVNNKNWKNNFNFIYFFTIPASRNCKIIN